MDIKVQQGFVLHKCDREGFISGKPIFLSLEKAKVESEQTKIHGMGTPSTVIKEHPVIEIDEVVYILEYGHSFPLNTNTSKNLQARKETALEKLTPEDRAILGI